MTPRRPSTTTRRCRIGRTKMIPCQDVQTLQRVQPRHTRKNTRVIRPYPDSGFLMARVPRRVSILQQDKVSRKKK